MWRKAVVVSCARPNHRGEYPYNLGARKCADWLRGQGVACDYYDGDPGLPVWEGEREIDLVALSVIFSWQAEVALQIALQMKDRAEVWCGGPGMSGLIPWWKLQTGLLCHRGIDERFDRQRGDYLMTFASRGCPVGCYFCLTEETTIQTADGLKPIVDVKVGDFVLTHRGRYRRVTEVLTRQYQGSVFELRNGAISELFPTVVTPEHPVWVRHVSYPTGGAHLTDFRWVDAGKLQPRYSRYSRDVTAFPRTRETCEPNDGRIPGAPWLPCDSNTLALIGWYLAEGYVNHAPDRGYFRVTFCLGHTDREMEYAREIVAAAAALGLRAQIWHPKIGIRVVIHNVKFVRWLVGAFGTGASTKRLPLWLRSLPVEMLAPLLDAWVKGDGSFLLKKGTDTWRVTTASPNLAVGLREIVLRMGYLATINRHHLNEVMQGRKVNVKPAYTVIYHAARELRRSVLSDAEYVYSPIGESVQRAYDGTVYNLEVEEDHSYCTPAFAVHNCVVPGIEGRTFTLDYDFRPAPILCDNNVSGLPVDFQEHIIARYQASGVPLLDCNSGYEPSFLDEACYRRWKSVLLGPFRFAFDEMREANAVEQVMRILREESPKKKRVYCMIGNEPLESCWDRVLQVIAWGGEPYCQLWLQPTWLGDPKKLKTRFDWTFERGRDFCRYVNRYVWRRAPLDAYNNRRYAPPPFAGSPIATPAWQRRWEAALADHRRFVRKSRNYRAPLQAEQAAQIGIDFLQNSLFDELDVLGAPHEPF